MISRTPQLLGYRVASMKAKVAFIMQVCLSMLLTMSLSTVRQYSVRVSLLDMLRRYSIHVYNLQLLNLAATCAGTPYKQRRNEQNYFGKPDSTES